MLNKATKIKFTTFLNYIDVTHCTLVTEPLTEFEQRFQHSNIGTKENTPVFMLAEFGNIKNEKGSLRHTLNIKDYYGVVLDIDNDRNDYLAFDDAVKIFNENDFYYIAYTTFKHLPQKHRFRIVIPFLRSFPKEHLAEIVGHFKNLLQAGDSLDSASKSISQSFIFPVCDKNGLNHYRNVINGKALFDPASLQITLPQKVKKERKVQRIKATPVNSGNAIAKTVNVATLNIHTTCKDLIRSGDYKNYRSRSEMNYAVIKHLIKRKFNDATIASIMLNSKNGISERCIEKGTQWTFEEIQRIRNKSQKLFPNVPPHFRANKPLLTPTKARVQIKEIVAAIIANPVGNYGIVAPAGLGKTQAVLEAIIESERNAKKTHLLQTSRFYEIYVPDHSLAEELKDAFESKSTLKVVVISGRDRVNKQGTKYCKKSDVVNAISDYGYNIHNTLCKGCEFRNQCLYLQQYETKAHVRIYTHSHLPLRRNLDKALPALAIIDENYFAKMIDIHKISVLDIKKYLNDKELSTVLCTALQNGKPLLTALKQTYGNIETLSVLQKAAKRMLPRLPVITTETSANEIKKLLCNDAVPVRKAIKLLLTQLSNEVKLFPERKHSITVRMVVDGDGQSNVVVANRHKMTRFTLDNHGLHSANSRVNVPVLCIDADFEPEVAKVFFPDIECLRINVERNAHVTQVYSALNTKKDFIRDRKKENNLKKIETFIRDISSKHERILVVSYKDIKPLLTLPEKCKFIHFGGLRGLNKFSDCDAVIVVGRHQLPIQAVESQAAALWWDADTPLTLTGKYKKQLRGYRLEDGEAGVKVDVCADSRSQLLMELQREKEFLQGVDRIRLINEGPQKSIYILTYLPAPITVNRLVSQTELFNGVLPIRSILEESGYAVLPLQPQYLHKNYKSLFTSKSVSKNAPAEEGLSATLLDFLLQAKEPITIGSTEMDIIEYKIEDQRGKYSKALVPKRMLTNKACVILRSLHNKDVDCVRTSKRSLQDLKPMQQSDELDGMMDLFEQYCAYDSSIHELCFTLPAH